MIGLVFVALNISNFSPLAIDGGNLSAYLINSINYLFDFVNSDIFFMILYANISIIMLCIIFIYIIQKREREKHLVSGFIKGILIGGISSHALLWLTAGVITVVNFTIYMKDVAADANFFSSYIFWLILSLIFSIFKRSWWYLILFVLVFILFEIIPIIYNVLVDYLSYIFNEIIVFFEFIFYFMANIYAYLFDYIPALNSIGVLAIFSVSVLFIVFLLWNPDNRDKLEEVAGTVGSVAMTVIPLGIILGIFIGFSYLIKSILKYSSESSFTIWSLIMSIITGFLNMIISIIIFFANSILMVMKILSPYVAILTIGYIYYKQAYLSIYTARNRSNIVLFGFSIGMNTSVIVTSYMISNDNFISKEFLYSIPNSTEKYLEKLFSGSNFPIFDSIFLFIILCISVFSIFSRLRGGKQYPQEGNIDRKIFTATNYFIAYSGLILTLAVLILTQ